MITYEELKEKCTCWKGYKRKPGTKPCADGSCIKEDKDEGGHGSDKHHALAFGRMNPITSGHEAVVNKLHSVAKEHGASHNLVVSHSQDAKKNPLSAEQKVKHAKNAFPGTNVSAASKEHPTILHHASEAHKAGATHLHVVAGSDRHEEMHNLLHKYNGQEGKHGHYNFKKITVHSSGERDPDAEGTTGISASKMREHASSGNKAEFHKGAPSKMKPEHKDAMYNDVRKGMGIHEEATPYWKKSSFNKRMSALAKQERLAREKKEAEQKKVTEHIEKVAGGYEVESEHGNKNLGKSTTLAGAKKRLKQVEYFKHMKEDNKHYDEAEEHLSKANDSDAKGDKKSFHAHMANHHEALSMWHDSKGRSASADKHAEKADFHHEKSITEETHDQQDDRAQQLKRFKDQVDAMSKANGPQKETETKLDNAEKKLMGVTKSVNEEDSYLKQLIGKLRKGMKLDKNQSELVKGHIGRSKAYTKHKNAISVEESKTGNPAGGYYGQHVATNNTDDVYDAFHAQVKALTDGDDKTVKHYLDSGHGKGLVGREDDHAHIKSDFKKFMKYYRPTMHKEPVKEGTEQPNGTDKIETSTSAPTASTSKDTTMVKKVKGFKFFKGENAPNTTVREDVELDETCAPVAPVPDRKYIKGTPEHKAHKEKSKPRTGHPSNVKEEIEQIDELSKDTVKKYKSYATLRAVGQASNIYDREVEGGKKPDPKQHADLAKTKKGLARADARLKEEAEELDEKSQQARRNKTYKNLMDASRGARVNQDVGLKPSDTGHKNNQQMNKAIGRAVRRGEMHEDTKTVNVDKVNAAGDKPHDEKWEPAKKSKLKKEETNMKSYKDFVQSLQEIKMADLPSRKVQGKSYGASYEDPEGAFETKDDMKKPEKKAAGRKTGQSVGSYKRRQPKAA